MSSKVYVDVLAEFTKDGCVIPHGIRWLDGTVYEIRKIIDIRKAVSLKAGGAGLRYTCLIGSSESFLFYEENNMWFVEAKNRTEAAPSG